MKNKGGAPKGNKNGEVWTLDQAYELSDKILAYVEKTPNCRHLGKAEQKCGEYDGVMEYLSQKYNVEFGSIKKAKGICASRLIDGGLEGELNPTMAIFILKNNHGMKDRQDITSDDKPIDKTIDVVVHRKP